MTTTQNANYIQRVDPKRGASTPNNGASKMNTYNSFDFNNNSITNSINRTPTSGISQPGRIMKNKQNMNNESRTESINPSNQSQ